MFGLGALGIGISDSTQRHNDQLNANVYAAEVVRQYQQAYYAAESFARNEEIDLRENNAAVKDAYESLQYAQEQYDVILKLSRK